MLKSMRQAVDGILNYPRIVSVGTVLFFCIFGVAILLVVLNAKLIGDQMSRDFNQRQLILAQQTARAIEMALSQMQDDIETIDAIIAGGDGWPGHSNIAARISGNDTLWGLVDIGLLGPGSAVWSFLDTDGGGLLTPELLADLADRCDCDTLISKMQIVQARDGVGSRVTAIFAKRTTKPGDAGRILCGRIDIGRYGANAGCAPGRLDNRAGDFSGAAVGQRKRQHRRPPASSCE